MMHLMLTLQLGLGYYTRRKGWLTGGPREPRELLGREQRRHQLVHRFMGFSGMFRLHLH